MRLNEKEKSKIPQLGSEPLLQSIREMESGVVICGEFGCMLENLEESHNTISSGGRNNLMA